MALILASASAIRRTMLEQAGVEFEIVPACVDEDSEKALHDEPSKLAETLAIKKALNVSQNHSGWVIGSDSVASVDGRCFDKPADRQQAAEHLRSFSGKALRLTSAAALASDGDIAWSLVDTALLSVRPLSDKFIDTYLDSEWPEVGCCVGAFRLEGRGIQLFDAIEGSYFTVLGMPLLPLLGALRERQVIAS